MRARLSIYVRNINHPSATWRQIKRLRRRDETRAIVRRLDELLKETSMCGGKKSSAPAAPTTVVTSDPNVYMEHQQQVAASQSGGDPMASYGSELTSGSASTGANTATSAA